MALIPPDTSPGSEAFGPSLENDFISSVYVEDVGEGCQGPD